MSGWEEITDRHKDHRLMLVVLQPRGRHPPIRRLVRWGRILGQGVWVDADGFHYYQPDEFTHAFVVPEFKQEKQHEGTIWHRSSPRGEAD